MSPETQLARMHSCGCQRAENGSGRHEIPEPLLFLRVPSVYADVRGAGFSADTTRSFSSNSNP
jgi:hypothetical protein